MAKLSYKKKAALPKKEFALPSKEGYGSKGKYPIPDAAHARNALARAAQFASPAEQKRIRAAVHKKFPFIK